MLVTRGLGTGSGTGCTWTWTCRLRLFHLERRGDTVPVLVALLGESLALLGLPGSGAMADTAELRKLNVENGRVRERNLRLGTSECERPDVLSWWMEESEWLEKFVKIVGTILGNESDRGRCLGKGSAVCC